MFSKTFLEFILFLLFVEEALSCNRVHEDLARSKSLPHPRNVETKTPSSSSTTTTTPTTTTTTRKSRSGKSIILDSKLLKVVDDVHEVTDDDFDVHDESELNEEGIDIKSYQPDIRLIGGQPVIFPQSAEELLAILHG